VTDRRSLIVFGGGVAVGQLVHVVPSGIAAVTCAKIARLVGEGGDARRIVPLTLLLLANAVLAVALGLA
jgi:hypothetical protein